MLIKQSLKAGLITGLVMALLAFVIFLWWDSLRVVWPIAFVPLFVTGLYAMDRAGSAVASGRRAALAGALAGLVAAAVSALACFVLAILQAPLVPQRPGAVLWSLVSVLVDSPFFVPAAALYYDVPAFPFPWIPTRTTPEGLVLARIPLTLAFFFPVGALLAALQAWLYYALVRQANVGLRAVGRVARLRTGFQTKLRVGFVILSVLIFAVGWLGWGATEDMHFQVHTGRATQHWLEHTIQVQASFRAQSEAVSQLANAPTEATFRGISSSGEWIAAELAHLKTVPPPAHQAATTGAIASTLRREAEKRLPAVREADSRFGDLNRALAGVVDAYRRGNIAEAQALMASAQPLQRAVEAPLLDLAGELQADMVRWVAQADQASHNQQFVSMFLVLLATALAFPLGYVFSQVVVRPVSEVGQGLQRIGSGDFSTQVRVENQDELGELAQRVNQMSIELDGLYAELRVLNENLQQKVDEQIQEIEHARELKRYLSPQVAESIISGESDAKLATTRKNLTVCFADIRGFTGLSERMEPEELIDLLNGYFGAQTEIAFRHGGTLDKYYGDGMMVFFGDPIPYNDHAERAVRMALEMRSRLPELQKQWFMEQQETLNIGIGISTGYVTVGNIGSPARLDYTVIGNNVNLASRLADMASPGQILVTEKTMVQVREAVRAQEFGEVTVEGSARPVRIYEVLDQLTPVS